jgi:hypothetical protein
MTRDLLKVFPLEFGRGFTDREIETIRNHLLEDHSHAIVAGSWNFENFDGVQFVDCGSGLERITCPLCREKVALSAWRTFLNQATSNNGYDPGQRFALECGHEFPLHALNYKDKCAFASVLISVEVSSHVWMGWLKELPWIDYIEASYV